MRSVLAPYKEPVNEERKEKEGNLLSMSRPMYEYIGGSMNLVGGEEKRRKLLLANNTLSFSPQC